MEWSRRNLTQAGVGFYAGQRRVAASGGAGSAAEGASSAPSSCACLRGLFLEEHRGLSVADLEGADERRQLGGEDPPLRGLEPLEARDQACLADLGGLAEQGPTGRRESDGRATGIVRRRATDHQAALGQPAHHDGHGALMGQGARGQLVDRRSVAVCELVEHEELCAADAEPCL